MFVRPAPIIRRVTGVPCFNYSFGGAYVAVHGNANVARMVARTYMAGRPLENKAFYVKEFHLSNNQWNALRTTRPSGNRGKPVASSGPNLTLEEEQKILIIRDFYLQHAKVTPQQLTKAVVHNPVFRGLNANREELEAAYEYLKSDCHMTEESLSKLVARWPDSLRKEVLQEKVLCLKEDGGFSSEDVGMLLSTAPSVLMKVIATPRNLRPALNLLMRDVGLDIPGVISVMTRHSAQLLRAEVRSNVAPAAIEFYTEKVGLSKPQLRDLVIGQPATITTNVDVLRDVCLFLVDTLGLTTDQLAAALIKSPQLLKPTGQSMNVVYHFLTSKIGMSKEEVSELVVKVPGLLGYSVEKNLKWTVGYLRNEVGLTTEELKNAVQAAPGLLPASVAQQLRYTATHLVKDVGFTSEGVKNLLVHHPSAMLHNWEAYTKVRFLFATQDGAVNTTVSPTDGGQPPAVPTGRMTVAQFRENFVSLVACDNTGFCAALGCTLEEYTVFANQYMDSQTKQS